MSSEIKRTFVFDGAFGTYYSKLFGSETACEEACITNSQRVLKIHKEYINAGAMAIKTNTFAANTVSLGCGYPYIEKIIKAAVLIASEAVENTECRIFADIGPIPCEFSDAFNEYKQIVDLFIKQGVVNFLLETMNDLSAFEIAEYIKFKNPNAFVIVSFGVGQDGYTIKGIPISSIIKSAEGSSADSIGLNCICGPSHMLNIVSSLPASSKILSVMPNSGYASAVGGRNIYYENTDYFSEKMLEIKSAGAVILGGCCGTTPLHIKSLNDVLKKTENEITPQKIKTNKINNQMPNFFKEKLFNEIKVIAAELDPPFDADFTHLAEAAPYLKMCGADAITVADSPLARPRADSVIISSKISREYGIQTIPHLTCRDHNTIGLKSALLGGSIEGIQNILIVTGDPVPSVDRSEVKGVFATNSYDLISFVKHLNEDIFCGKEFFIGGALNINADNFQFELERAIKKINNGTQFFLTQPIFSDVAVNNLKLAKQNLNTKILAGIMPVAGYKNALFLNNEVPGINIPENVIKDMENKTPEETEKISVEYSMEYIKKAKDHCDGYYLMTPLKKYRLIGKLIKEIKKMEE